MTPDSVLAALALPASASVNQRIPKKLLLENAAATASDKRQISEGIEEIRWIAALKPTTIGIPEYHDEARDYLEIAVLTLALREGAKVARLCELLHRAIPYPLLLIVSDGKRLTLSLAHKRWAQNEAGKMVLDGDVIDVRLDEGAVPVPALLRSLSLADQPKTNLMTLYQGWIDAATAWHVAELTGRYEVASPEQSEARRAALQLCQELDARIAALSAAARKEKQLARQVDLNLEIQALRARRAQAAASL